MIEWLRAPVFDRSVAQILLQWPSDYLRVRRGLLRARPLFSKRSDYVRFRDEVFNLHRLRRQMAAFRVVRKIVSVWRVFHVVLALFLIVLIAIHIYISVYYGYRWIF